MSEKQEPLRIAVGHESDLVFLQFDRKITFAGLTPEAAQEIAAALIEHAKQCKGYKPYIATIPKHSD